MATLTSLYDKVQPSEGPYSTLVFIKGNKIVAQKSDGTLIASGVAGIDDMNVLQNAINSLGTIFIKNGNYTISSGLTIPTKTRIIGESRTQTVFTITAAITGFTCDDFAQNIFIENCTIKSNRSQVCTGIHTGNATLTTKIKDVVFDSINGRAIEIQTSWIVRIENCQFAYCGNISKSLAALECNVGPEDATYVTIIGCEFEPNYYQDISSTYKVQKLIIEDCWFEGENVDGTHYPTDCHIFFGLQAGSGPTAIRDCFFYDASGAKCSFLKSGTNLVSNITLVDNHGSCTSSGYAIDFPNVDHLKIRGNGFSSAKCLLNIGAISDRITITENFFTGGENGNYLLYIDGITDGVAVIANNIIKPGIGAFDLYIHGRHVKLIDNDLTSKVTIDACQNVLVEGNTHDAMTLMVTNIKNLKILNNFGRSSATMIIINNGSSGVIIKGNTGYITEATGSSTGIGIDKAIAHGLAQVPTKVWIIPKSAGTTVSDIWLDASYIHCTVTTGKSFNWTVEV